MKSVLAYLLVFIPLLLIYAQEPMKKEDNKRLNAVQYRIARPTNNLEEVTAFYRDALGMRVIGSFENHEGYDGVMLGMPGVAYHLEFTQDQNKHPLPKPTKENLLFFYFDTPQAYLEANERMKAFGIQPVQPENPYWEGKSLTYEDPDQWRIILFNGLFESF